MLDAQRHDAERELPLTVSALLEAADPAFLELATRARLDGTLDALGERLDDLLLVRRAELVTRLEERLRLVSFDPPAFGHTARG